MTLLDRMRRRRRERRAEDVSWQALAALAPTGVGVNARMAENLSTVLACVSAISTAIASLPAWVYRRDGEGRAVADGHAAMRLIRRGPNQHQTWPDFVEWLVASTLLRGNGLAEIVTGRAGAVTALAPIPWEWVSVQLLANGRLAYDVTEMTSLGGGAGRSRRLLQDEVLHLRDRTDDGLVGRSRLQRAAATVRAGLAVQDFAAATYDNGAHPSGVLEAEGKLSEAALGELQRHFADAFTGQKNAAKAMVLDQGLKWKSVSISPEDAELLASRRFSTEELARIFGCPPPIIGDLSHGTFTNSETAGRWFAMHTMLPWLRKLEAEFARSVFSDDDRDSHHLELDLTGFLRGDPETRWKSHEIGVRNGILTPNEVRLAEGWNPRDDGDTLRAPQPAREAAA
jgi:HK97 family phage portal protein